MKILSENVIPAISIVTILSILMSVIHEYVFYSLIAPDLVDLQSANDFLITALRWLPAAVLGSGIYLIANIVFQRIELTLSDKESVTFPPVRIFSWIFHRIIYVVNRVTILITIGVFLLWAFFMPGQQIFPLIVLLFVAWIFISFWLFRHPKMHGKFDTPQWPVVVAILPLLILAIASGASKEAERIQTMESEGNYSINLKRSHAVEEVHLIRNLAAGVLVFAPDGEKLHFFPWDEIKSVTTKPPPLRTESRMCEWFKIGCGLVTDEP